MLASLDRYVKDSTDSFTARFAGHACATLWVRGPFPAPPRLTLTARSSCSCRGLEARQCLPSSSSWPSFLLRCTSCVTDYRSFGGEVHRASVCGGGAGAHRAGASWAGLRTRARSRHDSGV